MSNELKHVVIPVVVIVCATALLLTHTIDVPTALTMISTSGAYGAVAVGVSGNVGGKV